MAQYLCTDFLVDCSPSPHDYMNSQDFSLVEMTKPLFATKIKKGTSDRSALHDFRNRAT